jgi:hypothetical protein
VEFRRGNGFVVTGNLDIAKQKNLRGILFYGARFRTLIKADPLVALTKGLDEFIEKSCAGLCNPHEMRHWRQAVLKLCAKQLASKLTEDKGLSIDKAAEKYLSFLQQYLVFVPVDKAGNNISLICKSHYLYVLAKELQCTDGSAYCNTDESQLNVVVKHKKKLSGWKLLGAERLPYLYWIPKIHKNPIGSRFIAASGNCTTTTLSKVLSDVLSLILTTLRNKDDDLIRRTGVRRYFVVQSYDETAEFVARWSKSIDTTAAKTTGSRLLYTGDFATMYTAIPHADLFIKLKQAVKEAWTWEADRNGHTLTSLRIVWTEHGVEWSPFEIKDKHSEKQQTLSSSKVLAMLDFLLKNIFLVNGTHVFRQRVGIPMGTNCAPNLANL